MTARFMMTIAVVALVVTACEAETAETTLFQPGNEAGSEDTTVTVPPTTEPTVPVSDLEDVRRATVKVQTKFLNAAGEYVSSWWGTGSIVDPSGLILTNAHVAAPEAPGLEILYAGTDINLEQLNPQRLEIGMFVAEDQLPEFRYVAEVVTVDGWLDLAVLRIVSDLEGNPVDEEFPSIPIGDSDALEGNDAVVVVGYPDVGGPTMSTASGIVSGFLPDDKIDGMSRGWIKTDAIIRGGNSGGVAVNSDFELVGVPTRGGAEFGELRPVSLAQELIDDARSGVAYERGTGVVAGSGQESVNLIGWSAQDDPQECLIGPATSLASGLTRIHAGFTWAGFVPGEDLAWQWMYDDEPWYQGAWDTSTGWDGPETGECLVIRAGLADYSTLPDGVYAVIVYAGERLRRLTAETVTVGGQTEQPADAVTIEGRIVDGDSGEALADGHIGFLVPGTDAGAWWATEELDESKIAAYARVNSTSYVQLDAPLQRGVDYPYFIVPLIEGYAVNVGCCYTLPPDFSEGTIQVDFQVFKATP